MGKPDKMADAMEIQQKISKFTTTHAIQMQEFNRFYKMYRVQPTKQRTENQSNTVVPELFVEVEALATAMFEMIFSDDSENLFFDMVAQDGGPIQWAEAMVSKSTLAKQMELVKFQKKVMPFLRMLCLMGNQPVHVPWRLSYKSYYDDLYKKRMPAFDCWDFQTFPLVNYSFDDTQGETEDQEWCAQTYHVTAMAARQMAAKGLWNQQAVEDSLRLGLSRNVYDREQRLIAGYIENPTMGEAFTVHEYYGTLRSRDDGETYWAVVNSSGQLLKDPELNPYAHGDKPWLFCKWFDIPTEPYAMGSGHINFRTQSEINDRRNFINDLLYSSLYNMWLKRSDSGIALSGNKMKYSPHQIIEGDMISDEFFRALRPDLAGLGPAINLESNDIDKMRRQSGATSTLQAVATGITATETQQIQSEATRRLKAMVRSNVASFLRDFLYRAHQLNLQFLDQPVSTSVLNGDGMRIWGQVTRHDLIVEPEIRMKLTTDLDFRPFKRRELLDLLQTFGQLQANGMLGQRQIVPDPIIEQIAASYGMDPRKFFSKPGLNEMMVNQQMANPQVQQQAMGQMMQGSQGANQLMNMSPAQKGKMLMSLPGAAP